MPEWGWWLGCGVGAFATLAYVFIAVELFLVGKQDDVSI